MKWITSLFSSKNDTISIEAKRFIEITQENFELKMHRSMLQRVISDLCHEMYKLTGQNIDPAHYINKYNK